jgi:hypothetical protein
MSHPTYRWKRPAALLAAGIIAGAPLLAPGAAGAVGAAAARVDAVESGRQVTFSGGGLLGLSCAAEPSTGSVTITAETTLRVVNRTGHRATLLLDGAARGEVAKGGAAEVLFHRGPVQLALKPHCVLAEQKTVRVQVVTPRPPADEPATGPARPGNTGGGPSGGAATGGSTTSGGSTAGRGTGDGAVQPGRQPAAGARGREEDPALVPGADPASEDPDVAGAGTSVAESPPQVNVGEPGADLAAEPLGSVEPISGDGPIGLLAIIAIVCVLGVSVGAMRAILSQRASRASLAIN